MQFLLCITFVCNQAFWSFWSILVDFSFGVYMCVDLYAIGVQLHAMYINNVQMNIAGF